LPLPPSLQTFFTTSSMLIVAVKGF